VRARAKERDDDDGDGDGEREGLAYVFRRKERTNEPTTPAVVADEELGTAFPPSSSPRPAVQQRQDVLRGGCVRREVTQLLPKQYKSEGKRENEHTQSCR
jgi:hypothetical protein